MKYDAIRGNQWSNSALAGSIIEGNQCPYQWQSVEIRANQSQSETMRGNQRKSIAIPMKSEAISGQTAPWRPGSILEGNQCPNQWQ